MDPLEFYGIPPYLRRRRPNRPDLGALTLLIAGGFLFAVGLLFFANEALAAETGHAGIVKDGEIMTVTQLCGSLI